jgi:acetolactate synthase-1/2/3 large subunit
VKASQSERLAAQLADALARAGTRLLFGMPGGGSNLDVIGAAESLGIDFVLSHGENAAAIEAATYGELTGRPGAFVATRGPGAASAVNGVAHALLERAPLIAVTDCVVARDRAHVSHQRIDQATLFAAVTKWSSPLTVANAEVVLEGAVAVATGPPPGPVHLDCDAESDAPPAPRASAVRGEDGGRDLEAAREAVERARKPLVLLGVGARGAADSLRRLLVGTSIPVLPTYKAKGVVPDSWSNVAGVFTGARIESRILNEADLVLAVGFDPVEALPGRWEYDPPLVALAEWPSGEGYVTPLAEVIAPLGDSLDTLGPHLHDGWPAGRGGAEREEGLRSLDVAVAGLSPLAVVAGCVRLAPAGAVATVDAGAHMLVAMPYWNAENAGEVVVSSGLASMGVALPAAIAASLLRPQARVFCFTGDGGLGMVVAELETLARLGSRIIVVVFNDSALSLIRIKQKPAGQGGTSAVAYGGTDWAAIAAGFGLRSHVVDDASSLEAALTDLLGRPGPALIDARVDPSGYHEILRAIRG